MWSAGGGCVAVSRRLLGEMLAPMVISTSNRPPDRFVVAWPTDQDWRSTGHRPHLLLPGMELILLCCWSRPTRSGSTAITPWTRAATLVLDRYRPVHQRRATPSSID
jgi:hypothetical protein